MYQRIYKLTLLVIVAHIGFTIFIPRLLSEYDLAGKVMISFFSIFTIIVFVHLVKLLSFGRKRLCIVLSSLVLLGYCILYASYYIAGSRLDFLLLFNNAGLVLYKTSINMITATIPPLFYIFLGLMVPLVCFLEWKVKLFSERAIAANKKVEFVIVLVVYLLLLLVPIDASDEVYSFNKSISKKVISCFSFEPDNIAGDYYPYFQKENKLHFHASNKIERPNVFIIFMESFNAFMVERVENGKEVTPFFNELIKKGLYIDHFYGNSVQTAKGQIATLAGIVPSVYNKIFVDFPNLNLYAIPWILRDNGYYNLFMKAYWSLEFDNTGNYAKKLGYNETHGMTNKFLTKEDRKLKWGWGIQDNIFYQKVFKHLDGLREKQEAVDETQPFFVTLTSVSHHVSFNKVPEDKKYIYPKSKVYYENFINSTHLADKFLREFFVQLEKRDYLENSIVIVMGDHSYPVLSTKGAKAKSKAVYNTTYYEENFRSPFLLLWPDRMKPRRFNDHVFSQVDIAPTLMDLLNLKTPNHFMGRSMFDKDYKDQPIYLVQPYGGIYLAAVRYPYKFVRRMTNGKQYLFNLKSDPWEKNNILDGMAGHETLEKLKGDVDFILRHEGLIKANRLWPVDDEDINKNAAIKAVVRQHDEPVINMMIDHEAGGEKTFYIERVNFLTNSEKLTHATSSAFDEEANIYKNNFSVEMETLMDIKKGGMYSFIFKSSGGITLQIDDILILNARKDRSQGSKTAPVHLDKGKHKLKIVYVHNKGKIRLQVSYRCKKDYKNRLVGQASRYAQFVREQLSSEVN